MYRTITGSLFVAWNNVDWTSETTNLIEAVGTKRQLSRAQGQAGVGLGTVGNATFRLRNTDGRYSPDNTNSPISGSISGGQFRNKKARIETVVDGSGCTLWTGFIRDLQEDAQSNEVVLECEDRAALLSDQKISTSLMQDLSTGSYVESVLIDAGLAASDFDVDYGYSRIPFAWMDDEPVWQELGLAAEVETGRTYVDRFGVVHFDDAAAMVVATSALSMILSPSNVENFMPAYDWSQHYNIIRVEYLGRQQGRESVIYQAGEPIVIHPGETKTHYARLDMPALTIDTPVTNQDYFARSAGGLDMSASVTLVMSTCAQKASLAFTNNSTVFTAFVSHVRLVGILSEARYTATVAASSTCSVDYYGNLTYEFPFNPHIQDSVHAHNVAVYLRDRLEAPKRVVRIEGVPGSVTAMPGVLVEFAEPTWTNISGSGYIVETTWTLSDGFVMDLVLVTSNLFIYSDYFMLDRDECGGSPIV